MNLTREAGGGTGSDLHLSSHLVFLTTNYIPYSPQWPPPESAPPPQVVWDMGGGVGSYLGCLKSVRGTGLQFIL